MSVPGKKGRPAPRPMQGGEAAKKTAAVIFEVLAGLRSPTEGSEVLGISSMRYYLLERRALEGMVQALEPRPKGKRARPEEAMKRWQREKRRLERELGRMQALVRVTQRTMGLPPAPSREKRKGQPKKRRPSVRAMKVVTLLQAGAPSPGEAKNPEVSG